MELNSLKSKEKGQAIDLAISNYHLYYERNPKLDKGLRKKFDLYISDPRTESVIDLSVQEEFEFKYGKHMYQGRIDQIRKNGNVLEIWDIKYSMREPKDLALWYLPQLVIYAYAFKCAVGGIVNVRNYGMKKPVHIRIDGVDVDKCMKLIDLYIRSLQKCNTGS